MRTVGTLSIGWVDSSINAIAKSNILPSFAFLLVSSLDSITDLRDVRIAKELAERHTECGFVGQGLIIPGNRFRDFVEAYNPFRGFDEIWCFESKPSKQKPQGLSIVSPLNLGNDDVPQSLASWIAESGCRLGLGDGIGLNYLATDAGLAKAVEDTVSTKRGRDL